MAIIRDDRPVPLTKSCQLVGGRNGEPQNFSPDWHQMGVTDCRMTKGAKQNIRRAAEVRPCAGYVDASKRGVAQSRTYSKKEMRALAISVLRERGIEINQRNIGGILSGKTL